MGINERRDTNPAYMEEFQKTLDQAFTDYLGHYGAAEINLYILYTRSRFRRRGAGSLFCKWGIDLAALRGSYRGAS